MRVQSLKSGDTFLKRNYDANECENLMNIEVIKCHLCEKILGHGNYGQSVLDVHQIMECGDKDCLWVFWESVHHHPLKLARRLFPTHPRGYLTATIDLGHYASNKSVAINERLKGNIQTAMVYETICENIYKILPDYARW